MKHHTNITQIIYYKYKHVDKRKPLEKLPITIEEKNMIKRGSLGGWRVDFAYPVYIWKLPVWARNIELDTMCLNISIAGLFQHNQIKCF